MHLRKSFLFLFFSSVLTSFSFGQTSDVASNNSNANIGNNRGAFSAYEVELFTNPISNVVYIKSQHQPRSIEFMSASGKHLFTVKGGNELNMDGLSKGTYKVRIKFAKGETVKTFNY